MDSFWTPLITGALALFSVWFGSWLSSSSNQRQKSWELRRAAYGPILAELSWIERICDRADEFISEDPIKYFESKARDRHNDEIAERLHRADKRYADDYLIMSREFISLYAQMRSEMQASSDPNTEWLEEHEGFEAAIKKFRPLLTKQARKEIDSDSDKTDQPFFIPR